MSALFIPISSY